MGNRRIILELDREPQDLQAVWRLDSIARLIQQALVTANRNERSARLLSGGTEGSSRKYHHWSALSRNDLSNKPAA